jgi:signal transduction histidine kinase
LIIREGKEYLLKDLNSKNGTFVNGESIRLRKLAFDDKITFAKTTLHFSEKIITDTAPVEETDKLYASYDLVEDDQPFMNTPVKIPLDVIERDLTSQRLADKGIALSERKLAVLYKLSNAVAALQEEDEILSKSMDLILEAFLADRAYTFLYDAKQDELVPKIIRKKRRFSDEDPLVLSRTILREVLEQRNAIFTTDATDDSRFDGSQSIQQFNIRSVLAVPLKVKDEILGVVYLDNVSPAVSFTKEDLKLLAVICYQTAASFQNARLYDAVRKARDEIQRWNEQLEIKVRERTREIQRLSDQKDEFLGMVAHDLRTPLTCIMACADVMSACLEESPKTTWIHDELQTIMNLTNDMRLLLNDLLDVTKIEVGKIQIFPVRSDISEVLKGCADMYQRWAESKDLQLSIEIEDGLPDVWYDRKRLGQVINNLIHNAIKFTPEEGVVKIQAEKEGDFVAVSVSDTGPGIEPEELDLIFAKFERAKTKGSAADQGAGLGLAIAKKLVETHGGELRVHSIPGKGTRFTFTLPTEKRS